jgi:hypothetical protein
MKLKDIVTDIVIDPRKLTEYALNFDNPKGADKAMMFERHLGFTRDNYQLLLDKITATVLDAEAILQRIDIHGQRYQVDLEIIGIQPEQKEIVRTGWIVEQNSNVARLVTLYIRKRK